VAPVARFIETAGRRGMTLPGMYGVFYYRSANRRTLETLHEFLPVPIDELTAEFASGATPDDVCARTISALMAAGAKHFYISNLPVARAQAVLERVMSRVAVR
jgi:hypothetical protein